MLIVGYSQRVRKTCLSAMAAGGAARPAQMNTSHERFGNEGHSAPSTSGRLVYTSFPAIYDRTPAPVLTDNGRRSER